MNEIDKDLQREIRRALAIVKAHSNEDISEASKDVNLSKTIAGAISLKPDEDTNALIASRGLVRAAAGELLTGPEREALKGYIELFTTIITTPNLRARLKDMQRTIKKSADVEKSQDEPKENK